MQIRNQAKAGAGIPAPKKPAALCFHSLAVSVDCQRCIPSQSDRQLVGLSLAVSLQWIDDRVAQIPKNTPPVCPSANICRLEVHHSQPCRLLQLKHGLKCGSKHHILIAFSQHTLLHPLFAERFDHTAKTLVNELDTREDKT
jgi:hypothetical protein